MSIRIMIADDHKVTREGIKALIRNEPGMEVICEAGDGQEAIAMAENQSPQIIVMDISMPGLNGIDAARQIKAKWPRIKIIALSMYSERRYVAGMLEAGVSGYLLKNGSVNEIIDALRAVISGKTYLSPDVAKVVFMDYVQGRSVSEPSTVSVLTKREREILQLIAEGFSSIQIASRLHVSEKTVSTHRRKIMEKLSIFNVAGLTKYAVREGLTSLET